jgi:hypothetical protein
MKKVFTFLLMSIFLTFNAVNATDVSGTIISNTTWTAALSPYIVTGNITVNTGITLKIDSGVIVKFNSNSGIYVNGTLKARKAKFTSNITPLAKGAWGQIQSSLAASIITIDTCTVEYGGSGSNGSINAVQGIVTINSTTISNSSSAGIQLNTATVNVKNSSIFNCDWPIVYVGIGALHNNGGNNFSGNTHDAANIAFTTVSGNWNLESISSPYIISGNLTVNTGVTLSIESGAAVKFNAGLGIMVNGTLKARKAQFTSNVTPLAKGAWSQIQSGIAAAVITLDTCTVDYGGSANLGSIYAARVLITLRQVDFV